MTHFAVTVLGDNIDAILEPYNENKQVKPYLSKPAYIVKKEFIRHKGSVIAKNAPYECLSDFDKLSLSLNNPTKEWLKQWNGMIMDDEGNGLSRYNPKSKWDWHSLGGRWMGLLTLKKGAKGNLGVPGVFDNHAEKGTVDQCRICDVDWKKMHKEAQIGAGEDWDNMMKPYEEMQNCWFNKEYVESQKKLHIEMYGTKEEYIRRRGYWTTYALLSKETGWIAPGEMGWWGMHTDETADRDEYDRKFVETIKSFPKTTMISIVDCHI